MGIAEHLWISPVMLVRITVCFFGFGSIDLPPYGRVFCGSVVYSLVVVYGLFVKVASLVAEQGL